VAKHVAGERLSGAVGHQGLKEALSRILNLELPVDEWAKEEGIAEEELTNRVCAAPTSTWPPRSPSGAPT